MGVQFARADLTRSAMRLLDDGVMWVPGEPTSADVSLCALGQIGEIGPDRRRLVDGFDRTTSQTAYPMVEGHDTELRTSLVCEPDTYLSPLANPRGGQRPGYGQHLWQMAGTLLVSERIWLNTVRITSMCTEMPVLSNVVVVGQTGTNNWEKSIAVWLNSSVGLLTLMATRSTTRGAWVALKKADLREMPVWMYAPYRNRSCKRWRTYSMSWLMKSSSVCPRWRSARRGGSWMKGLRRYWGCRTCRACGGCWRRSLWCRINDYRR